MKSLIYKLIPSKIKKKIKEKFTVTIYKTEKEYVLNTENKPFLGKNAVVTGGNGAIGSAICVLLAAKGACVYVSGRSESRIEKTVKKIRDMGLYAYPMVMDVASEKSIEDAFGEVFDNKNLDILVCCAGGGAREKMSSLKEQSVDVIDDTLNTNLRGSILCTRQAAKYMTKMNAGSIALISSTVGIQGKANYSEYAAAKSGMLGFVKSMALELGKYGITINCISPGIVQRDEYNDKTKAYIESTNCMNQICTAEDVAEAVDFMVSDKARFITGQNLVVDGGRTLGMYGD